MEYGSVWFGDARRRALVFLETGLLTGRSCCRKLAAFSQGDAMRRFVLWGSLLAAAASLGLYLGRSGPHASAQAVRLDPSLIALLPPDATTLLGVDVQRLKKTAVYQHMEEQGRKQNS